MTAKRPTIGPVTVGKAQREGLGQLLSTVPWQRVSLRRDRTGTLHVRLFSEGHAIRYTVTTRGRWAPASERLPQVVATGRANLS